MAMSANKILFTFFCSLSSQSSLKLLYSVNVKAKWQIHENMKN